MSVKNVLLFQNINCSISPCTPQNVTNKKPIVLSKFLSKFKYQLDTSLVNENLVPQKASKPCPDYSWVNIALYFKRQKLEQMQLNLNYIKYIFSNHLFKKSNDVATPVQPKPKECPTLIAAAYVGLGASRDQKGGVIYPQFYGNFYGIYSIKNPLF